MLKITSFRRLGLMYIIALASIILTIVISQLLIQSFIAKQASDSRVINVAGKQRMLSQNISKLALKIKNNSDDHSLYYELRTNADLWVRSDQALRYGSDSLDFENQNSEEINHLFEKIEQPFKKMVLNAMVLSNASSNDSSTISNATDQILSNESSFLTGMESIVLQYDKEAKAKVQRLKKIEYILFAIALLIIVLEFVFLFLPTSRKVVSTFNDLVKSEESAKKMTAEVNKLYIELGKSYQDLEAVNIIPEEPSILLKSDYKGNLTYTSDKFREIMSMQGSEFSKNLFDWLKEERYNDDFLLKLEKLVAEKGSWSGELNLTNEDGDLVWLDMFIQTVPTAVEHESQILAIGRDITDIKEAKQRSREINRELIEKRVKEQQYRSVLILEGQEEERKRISAEIHDGIGQMLTGLKLNLEGITASSSPHMKKRILDARDLMKSIIKEVRRVSFNLTPSSLVDFGLPPALKKISQEVTSLSKTEVTFENKTGFINRLDKGVETNLYRICQEAVNNSIKYSQSSHILIILEHNSSQLIMSIEDNGKGFEMEKLEKSGHFGASGHGIFNMKERAAYIDAQMNIKTEIGKGTKITITLPLT